MVADAPGWRRLQPGLTRNLSGDVVFILNVKILSPVLVKINVWIQSLVVWDGESDLSNISSSCGLEERFLLTRFFLLLLISSNLMPSPW
jgi:hypothetical protein